MQISRFKKVLLIIILLLFYFISLYVTYYYVLSMSRKSTNSNRGRTISSNIILLDQNRSDEVKFLLVSNLYSDIVNASLKQETYNGIDKVQDLNYYKYLCKYWDLELNDIVIKTLENKIGDIKKSPHYENYRIGVKNIETLCHSKKVSRTKE